MITFKHITIRGFQHSDTVQQLYTRKLLRNVFKAFEVLKCYLKDIDTCIHFIILSGC